MKSIPQIIIIEDVASGLHPNELTDLSKIREALNTEMDAYEKRGMLSRAMADTWNQDRMVARVVELLKGAL